MDEKLITEVARNTGMEEDQVSSVLDEFLLQLNRRLYDYVYVGGFNGDYIGEALIHQISYQSFYHLLGFLDTFSDKYDWHKGSANEYLLRLGDRARWAPYHHQTEGWNKGKKLES